MGIIAKQSFYNLFSIGIGFLVGALNVLFLYPIYMGDSRQGLVVGLLAVSNLMQPFLSLGLQHALIKFFLKFHRYPLTRQFPLVYGNGSIGTNCPLVSGLLCES